MYKYVFYVIFAGLSLICMTIEMIELCCNATFVYSDHLHIFLEHGAMILINYIGFRTYKDGNNGMGKS